MMGGIGCSEMMGWGMGCSEMMGGGGGVWDVVR